MAKIPVAGYLMQLYNAYTLYLLSFHEGASWQVRSPLVAVT
jgi:hypothetical protein